jgi:DNA invertase Pin-like site-specific DNA recombinase
MKFGYARVSTREQNLDMQIKAFNEKGCEKIFQEKLSGQSKVFPELSAMMEQLRVGDQVYVWALDRMGRSLYQVIRTVAEINEKGAELVIITQDINTATPAGKMFVAVFAILAEMETELRKQRQMAGIQAAKLKGITGGRKKGLSDEARKKANEVRKLYLSRDPEYSVREISSMLKISTRTVYRYLDYLNVPRRGGELY